MLTYGDGISDQNIKKLEKFHLKHNKTATMTVVRPPVRFGEVTLKKDKIIKFKEKPQIQSSWINGGFLFSVIKFLNSYQKITKCLKEIPWKNYIKKSINGV